MELTSIYQRTAACYWDNAIDVTREWTDPISRQLQANRTWDGTVSRRNSVLSALCFGSCRRHCVTTNYRSWQPDHGQKPRTPRTEHVKRISIPLSVPFVKATLQVGNGRAGRKKGLHKALITVSILKDSTCSILFIIESLLNQPIHWGTRV